MKIKIKKLNKKEIKKVAKIASESFSGLKNFQKALKWIKCNFGAYPRMQYFVARSGNKIAGYILWLEKGGFRKEAVWELEQIAIKEKFRGQGIGTKLIKESLLQIQKYLKKRGSSLKLVEVTTASQNQAQKFYQKSLGVKTEAKIKNLFRGDEVIMIKRF